MLETRGVVAPVVPHAPEHFDDGGLDQWLSALGALELYHHLQVQLQPVECGLEGGGCRGWVGRTPPPPFGGAEVLEAQKAQRTTFGLN